MKKIKNLMFILFLLTSSATLAQVAITDTLGYLQDSIVAKHSYYNGRPLATLLNDLKLNVVQVNDGLIPHTYSPDTLYVPSLVLFFDKKEYSFDMIVKKSARSARPNSPDSGVNFHIKRLKITFTSPVPVSKNALMRDDDLGGWWWSNIKAAYYGQYIISTLEASEF